MGVYSFRDVTLEVQPTELEIRADLERLWRQLSWVRKVDPVTPNPARHLEIRLHDATGALPQTAATAFQVEGFSVRESTGDYFVSDGASVLQIGRSNLKADAYLHSSFYELRLFDQYKFWGYGLMKLLRQMGLYSLHAAGLITPDGRGVLISGPSGSGKSTAALALIRQRWSYLSDDAVLLNLTGEEVTAAGLRRSVYVDADAAPNYSDLFLGEEIADGSGGLRRRLHVEDAYPEQKMTQCVPALLLFSTIVAEDRSALRPLDQATALKLLLDASGPQLFDRATMAQHMEVLRRLLRQTVCYELAAGRDLLHTPTLLIRLLKEADIKAEKWRVSLSS